MQAVGVPDKQPECGTDFRTVWLYVLPLEKWRGTWLIGNLIVPPEVLRRELAPIHQ